MKNKHSARAVDGTGLSARRIVPTSDSWRGRMANFLVSRTSQTKSTIAIAADYVLLATSMLLAIALARSLNLFPSWWTGVMLAVAPAISILCLWAFGAYRAVVRFIDINFIERCLLAMLTAAVLLHLLTSVFALPSSWRSFISYAFVGFGALLMQRRLAARLLRPLLKPGSRTNVMIFGAGSAGTQLAAALDINSQFKCIGFIDDRLEMHGRTVRGLKVYSLDQVIKRKKQLKFERVLLAVPSAGRSRRRKILERLEPLAVRVLVMPGMEDLANGQNLVDELREVQVKDILDRDVVSPNEALLDQCIRDQSVMVTGAGGSIGSELCRQIVRRGASRLVLFESSEFALYSITQELAQCKFQNNCEIVPVLASVLERDLVTRCIRNHDVQTIYHAAAYKHVPLVESNPIWAVKNNVIGTLNVVEAAIQNAVKNFVLISTDKAVRPTNVMGASKRVCELIVQALARRHSHLRMAMVRFGNVLESSGSVVPLFRRQISDGGPVTVTHPEVTRYFMTIPEAVMLVIQAGSMGTNGEVFLLDMGQPVKILDLARRMIHLSGLDIREPGSDAGDIEIQFTGLRVGEKLFEELLIAGQAEATQHPRIFKAQEDFLEWDLLRQFIERLRGACSTQDVEVVISILGSLAAGFAMSRGKAESVALSTLSMDHRREAPARLRGGAGGL